ncbi:MAG: host attachment protein [Bdellovibrionales bacterium]
MSATWFVVLSQSSMKLFTINKENKILTHLQTVINPLVNLRGKDLTRHKPGSMPKGGKGSRRSNLDSGIRPHDLMVQNFALRMAKYLDNQRKRQQYAELRIAAEPKFLGLLKKALPIETMRVVTDWVVKDLEKADNRQLARAFVKRGP